MLKHALLRGCLISSDVSLLRASAAVTRASYALHLDTGSDGSSSKRPHQPSLQSWRVDHSHNIQHPFGTQTAGIAFSVYNALFAKAPQENASSALSNTDDLSDPPQEGFFPLAENSQEVTTAIYQATEAIERASIVAAKADCFFVAKACISGLQSVHEMTGAPWWLSIMMFSIGIRTLAFPLMVYSQKLAAGMVSYNHQLIHAKKLQEAAMKAKSPAEHNRLRNALQEETARVNASFKPARMFFIPVIMLINGGIFFSIFNGVRQLAISQVPSMTVGGTLWFADLTVPDMYFGLPIMCTVVTLAMVEFGVGSMGGDISPDKAQQTKTIKWLMRGCSLLFLPAGFYVASGTCCLWVANSLFAVFQGLLLRNDAFRRSVGMDTMEEMKNMSAATASAAASAASRAPPPGSAASPQQAQAQALAGLTPDMLYTSRKKRIA